MSSFTATSSTTALLSPSSRLPPYGGLSGSGSGVLLNEIPERVQRIRDYFDTHVTKSYEWRKKQLQALHSLLVENESVLVAAIQSDLRKPRYEASLAEVGIAAAETLRTLHSLWSWMRPEAVPTPLSLAPATSYIHREPYGVVLLIAPFNYPVQLVVLPLLSILAAGNCAVVKPSELTPAVSAALADLIPRYLDPSAICCVQGGVPEATALLRQRWDYIFFTGSEAVGKIVARAAAEHLTPVTLELGGKSPVIVDETADIPLAARRVVWGKTFNMGQTCIGPDYAFVHRRVKSRFLQEVARCIEKFYGRDPQQSPDLGRIVNVRHAERLRRIIEAHRNSIVVGGETEVEGRWVSPTIIDMKDSVEGKAMEEELFGPVLPVLEFDDIAVPISFINRKPKPLALYIFSSSSSTQQRFLNETSSGGICINDVLLHHVNKDLPFGGVGSSGIGSYHGRHGFLSLSHSKAVLHKSAYFDPSARYPPYTDSKFRVYKVLVSIVRMGQPTLAGVGKALLAAAVLLIVAKEAIGYFGLRRGW